MMKGSEEEKSLDSPTVINAFQLIGMSSFLDLSGFFEKEVTKPYILVLVYSVFKNVLCSQQTFVTFFY